MLPRNANLADSMFNVQLCLSGRVEATGCVGSSLGGASVVAVDVSDHLETEEGSTPLHTIIECVQRCFQERDLQLRQRRMELRLPWQFVSPHVKGIK